ncbi:MAG: AMP-dependent synthetase/ligase [Desulfocucumaceae bacterium]
MQNNYLSLSQIFYSACEKHSSRPAQVFNPDLYHNDGGGSFSYGDMMERVEVIAHGLLALGLEKGERAAIMSKNSPYWTHSDYAIINSGGVTVTIYPTLSLNEASYIINDSESRYLFVGSQEILDSILPGLEKMPSLKKVIVLDIAYLGSSENILGLSQLMDLGQSYREKNGGDYINRWQSSVPDDWATIVYTSGTTGMGKGAILTHYSMSSRLKHTLETFSRTGIFLTEEDVCLSFLPLSHIFDRGCCQFLALYTGACIAYADGPSTIMQDMQKYRPTWFNCVPRLYEKLYITIKQQMAKSLIKRTLFNMALGVGKKVLAYRTDSHGHINMAEDFDVLGKLPLGLRLSYLMSEKMFAKVRNLFGGRIKLAFSAGAGISAELSTLYYAMGLRIIEGYGLTETCTACNCNPLTGLKPGKVGPAANGSAGRLAEDGEYLVSGAGLFIGYLNKPEETAEVLTPDGWFKTGDLGIIDEDGYLKIVDRKKAIIVLSTGKNVAPAKIESFFSTSSAIEQVFVIGDEKKYISALLVPNFNYFIDLFDKEKINYDRSKLVYSSTITDLCIQVGEDFTSQPVLKEIIEREVEEANKTLEKFEAVKKYAVLSRRFTEENGEITPTLKPKKRVILENYKDIVKNLYSRR